MLLIFLQLLKIASKIFNFNFNSIKLNRLFKQKYQTCMSLRACVIFCILNCKPAKVVTGSSVNLVRAMTALTRSKVWA